MTMANKKMYSILDTAAQTFLNPITLKTDAEAIRFFTTEVNGDREKSNIARYPHQFVLFRMQDFDSQTGLYDTTMKPRELIIGTSCVEPENKKYTLQEIRDLLKSDNKTTGEVINFGGTK